MDRAGHRLLLCETMPKYFTVDEANRTLPLVRRIVEDIVAAHRELLDRMLEIRETQPDRAPDKNRRRELEIEVADLTTRINGYIAELEEIGAHFKGFEEGLVDFHAKIDNETVFLCWKLGEEQIEYWHELEAGYAGRRRLPSHLLSVGGGE